MIDINVETKVLGLIGHPLGHSISPLLHNQALDKLNLNYVYLAFEIAPEQLKNAVAGFRALQVKGINITIPYKDKIIPYLDQLDSLAEKIGAVNTLVNNDGFLKGYNTDAEGFKRLLEEDGGIKISGKKALILGAGGAARASGIVLCENGVQEIYLANRTLENAAKLAAFWQQEYPGIKIEYGKIKSGFCLDLKNKVDLIIDTTPVGMSPHVKQPSLLPAEFFSEDMLVVDLVYNPAETTILKAAKSAGAMTLNGLPMLLYQAAAAFEIWTKKSPDIQGWYNLLSKEDFLQ